MRTRNDAVGLLCFVLVGLCTLVSRKAEAQWLENKGQWPSAASHRCDMRGGAAWAAPNGYRFAWLQLPEKKGHLYENGDKAKVWSLWLEFADPTRTWTKTSSEDYGVARYSFFHGKDSKKWASNLAGKRVLEWKSKDITLKTEVLQAGVLKHTWIVDAGGDASACGWRIGGAKKIAVLSDGSLEIEGEWGQLREEKPKAWQTISAKGDTTWVECQWEVHGDWAGFKLGKGYKKNKPIWIDPTVIFASYSGSLADNFGFTGTYDAAGNAYGGGTAYAVGYPTSAGSYEADFQGGTFRNGPIGDIARDVALMMLNPTGTTLLYSTYLGSSDNEQPHSMVVDSQGNVLIMGSTYGNDFPVSTNAYQRNSAGQSDVFITKMDAKLSTLLASTYLGGSSYDGLNGVILNGVTNPSPLGYNYGDQFRGEIIVDKDGNVYVASTTTSNDFPTSTQAWQKGYGGGAQDGFVVKMSPNLQSMIWGTLAGGAKEDACYSLQLNMAGEIVVAGGTCAGGWMNIPFGYQQQYAGGPVDGFILKLSADGSKLNAGTYLGTDTLDQNYFVQIDAAGRIYAYGITRKNQWPVVGANYSEAKGKQYIVRLNDSLSRLELSSTFGSGRLVPDLSPTAFLVDDCGKIYVSGWGGDVNTPNLGNGGDVLGMKVTSDAFQTTTDASDFYVAVYAANMDTLLFASYFGGPVSSEHVDGGTSRFDKRGMIYQSVCGGCGRNSDFPTTADAHSRTNNSDNCNNLVFKVDLQTPDLVAAFDIDTLGCYPYDVKPVYKGRFARNIYWYWGDGQQSTGRNVTHTYTIPGIYTVMLVVEDNRRCSLRDTATREIRVYGNGETDWEVTRQNCTRDVQVKALGLGLDFIWKWGDSTLDIGRTASHTYPDTGTYALTLIVDSGTMCQVNRTTLIRIEKPTAIISMQVDSCNNILTLVDQSTFTNDSALWEIDGLESKSGKRVEYLLPERKPYRVVLKVRDSAGCEDSASVDYNPAPLSKASFITAVDTCKAIIQARNTSGPSQSRVWLANRQLVGNGDSVTLTYSRQDTMLLLELIINPGSACADTMEQRIKLKPVRRLRISYLYDTCSRLVRFQEDSGQWHAYTWRFGDGAESQEASPRHGYIEKGTYQVWLKVDLFGQGCFDSAEVEVSVPDNFVERVFIPNVFSPNGDGINDYWQLRPRYRCDSFRVVITNRWGQTLWDYTGNDFVWDGKTESGAPLPAGVYYYIFEGSLDQKESGTVHIKR